MGVSRNITIIVYTNIETSHELIQKFLIGFWIKSNSCVVNTFYEDETDIDILPKEIEFDKLEPIFNKREILNKVNIISFSVDTLDEGIILSINNLENTFNDDKMYEIWISPGGAHKLKEYERNTDFSYYLNLILPRFKEIGCYPFEIKCNDVG
ncbi:MAG: hypothetical protein IPK88_15535 [Saprospiraceae bacterium]|jgi:hypothetical protein|nr:hypothetical protein [Candidatus Defluviibacterium haderslevense]MCI1267240.1 hypothetical protein [Saprospiraceae bacterium]